MGSTVILLGFGLWVSSSVAAAGVPLNSAVAGFTFITVAVMGVMVCTAVGWQNVISRVMVCMGYLIALMLTLPIFVVYSIDQEAEIGSGIRLVKSSLGDNLLVSLRCLCDTQQSQLLGAKYTTTSPREAHCQLAKVIMS